MCGIVGYVGEQEALPILVSGLERLEYRGYDSAGVAVHIDGGIHVARALGKLKGLKEKLQDEPLPKGAKIGIGHTRWATHGRPSEVNAHPHSAGRVSLIHNGIIENYMELREELEREGSKFASETDTEIAAHLLNRELSKGGEALEALSRTCAQIEGSYAFLAIDAEEPTRILVAKNATPIVIGIGEDGMYVASDIPAILEHTRRVIILEDGDVAVVSPNETQIVGSAGPVKREEQVVTWDPVTAQKGGYKHFMLKEIHEQPEAVTNTFRGRVRLDTGMTVIPELSDGGIDLSAINRIVLVACGTAWHACLVGKFYFESLCRIPCEVDYASEFRYRSPVVDKNTLVLAISQSGETADTLAAIDLVREGSPTVAICNVLGSSLVRKVDKVLFTQAGPEISVASTKAFTTQLVAVYLLALHLAAARLSLSAERVKEKIEALVHLPGALEESFRIDAQIKEIARQYHRRSDYLFIGRGLWYPIALEGALKLKEISYIHAEGYPAGELKHGPIALIDEDVPVVVLLPRSQVLFEKSLTNLREVESRGAELLIVTDREPDKLLSELPGHLVELPKVSEELSPILFTVPLQLLAYYVAVWNGTDVDLPRNLAKSVTVE